MDLRPARGSDGFFDIWNGVGIDPHCEIEKQLRILQFAVNIHYALGMAVLGTANDEAVF